MIVSGYYGEFVVIATEADENIASQIKLAQVMTVISWCNYPVVYMVPMFGIIASQRQLWLSSWVTVLPTLFLNAEWDWSSTRSHIWQVLQRGAFSIKGIFLGWFVGYVSAT